MQRFNSFAILLEQPPQARTLFYAIFLFRCSTIAFPFYGAYLLAENVISIANIAFIIGAFGAGALSADLVTSVVLKYLRNDLVIKFSISTLVILLLAIGSIDTFLPLLALTFAWGFSYESVTPASYAMISDLYSGEENKMGFACNRLAINLGMAVGPIIGGLVYAMGSSYIFLVNSLALIVTTLFVFFRVGRVTSSKDEEVGGSEPISGNSTKPGENGRFWFVFMIAIPLHLAFALPPTMIGILVIDTLSESAVWVSIIFMLNALMIVFMELPINKHFLHHGYSKVMLWGMILSGCGFVLMGATSLPFILLGATVFWTLGEMTIFPTILGYINSISSRQVVKRNLSLYSAGVNIGILLAPPIALGLTSVSGGLPWILAGCGLLLSALFLFFGRNTQVLWVEGETQ